MSFLKQILGSKRTVFILVLIFVVADILLYMNRGILQDFRGITYQPVISKGREEIFKERKEHVIRACLSEGRVPVKTNKLLYTSLPNSKALFEMTNGVLYCPILKVGSTFLNRIMVMLSSNGTYDSPFAFLRRRAPTIQRLDKLKSLYKPEDLNKAFEKSVSFLAVRDPYTKLFSGYADKLFHPNYMFWRLAGQKIDWLLREDNLQGSEPMCGHDITFAEFIKYIIHEHDNENRINGHFTMSHDHCDPCNIEFDYILKIETFKDDTMYLLNVLNESFGTDIKFSNFEQETALDNAKQHIGISFITMRKYSEKCNLPILSFLFRTWRYLQISGIIPKKANLPIQNENSARAVTKDEFIRLVSGVISEVDNVPEVKLQRQEALLQAYRSVELEDLEKLRQIVEPDCRYFDYNCSLEALLSDKVGVKMDFDYFDAF